jgi:serine/threonine-protein phosphatase 2A regulatory subunit A
MNVIIDDLKSDDVRKRVSSVRQLNLIASAIGPERTKNELVPFLSGTLIINNIELVDDEDEVLLALIDTLSKNFHEYLGGVSS